MLSKSSAADLVYVGKGVYKWLLNPFIHTTSFWSVRIGLLLKTFRQKEKVLIISQSSQMQMCQNTSTSGKGLTYMIVKRKWCFETWHSTLLHFLIDYWYYNILGIMYKDISLWYIIVLYVGLFLIVHLKQISPFPTTFSKIVY